jgi:hypothetical protein
MQNRARWYNARMHWLGRHRLLILASICLFWTGLIFLGHFFSAAPFLSIPWRGEQNFEDLLRREGRKTATRNDFVLLGIDQSTLQLPPLTPEEIANNRAFQLMTEQPFPWSREVWALLLDRLFAAPWNREERRGREEMTEKNQPRPKKAN